MSAYRSLSRERAGTSESPTYTLEETSGIDPDTEMSAMSLEEMLQIQNSMGRSRPQPPSTNKGKTQIRNSGPLEVSSKNPVPFLRRVVTCKKPMQRDPRFDDLSGEYKPEIFLSTYRFLDDMKKKEREIVQKKLTKAREPQLKEKLQKLIHRMDQQEAALQRQQKLRDKDLEQKRRLREDALQGKRPFYLKKGDIRKAELADKYRELKRKGKVEHFLSKKRKRNSHKDRRRLPTQ